MVNEVHVYIMPGLGHICSTNGNKAEVAPCGARGLFVGLTGAWMVLLFHEFIALF